MSRNEITIDLTDSKVFETDITKSGNVVSAVIKTDYSKLELLLDEADFANLIAEGSLMLNKKKGVA